MSVICLKWWLNTKQEVVEPISRPLQLSIIRVRVVRIFTLSGKILFLCDIPLPDMRIAQAASRW